MRLPSNALIDGCGRSPQAHDKSALLQTIHVVLVCNQATTCGNNALAPVLHLPDEVLFHVPKRAFTLMREDFTDAALFLCFNPLIRIDESETQEFGKMSSNGGFSDSHESCQGNVFNLTWRRHSVGLT